MSGGKPAKPIVVEAVEDTPAILPHTYAPREGVDYLSSVTVGKDPNLVPGNVKKDVTIFGTVGTLESGGGALPEPNLSSGAVTPVFIGDTAVNVSGGHGSGICWNIQYGFIAPPVYGNTMFMAPVTTANTISSSTRNHPPIDSGTVINLRNAPTLGQYLDVMYLRNIALALGGSLPCQVAVDYIPVAIGGTSSPRSIGTWSDEMAIHKGTLSLTEDACTFTYGDDVPQLSISGMNSTDYMAFPGGIIIKAELVS